MQQNGASMGTNRRGGGIRQCVYQRTLLVEAQCSPASQRRTACQAYEQAVLPLIAILSGNSRQFRQMPRQLLLPYTTRHRTNQEATAAETLAFQPQAT